MSSLVQKTLLSLLILCSAPLLAQRPVDPGRPEAEIQTKKDALETFKNGDKNAGLGKLKGNINRDPGAPKEEIQITAQLVEVTHWLANEKHPSVSEVARLAVEEAGKSRSKLNRAEQAGAFAVVGQLQELILGDKPSARASYNAALAIDAREPEALKGIARLNALDALVAAKARDNEAVRQRSLNPGR